MNNEEFNNIDLNETPNEQVQPPQIEEQKSNISKRQTKERFKEAKVQPIME